MSIKAIIIDDEERARTALSSLLSSYCPEVEVIDLCANVLDGVASIKKNQPDLLFLDVEMPVYNGFELLNFFSESDSQQNPFEVIFVTAYSQHAITAFKVSAIDYILKPIDIDSLTEAVEKFKSKKQFTQMQERIQLLQENLKNEEFERIALPMSEGLHFVAISEIVFLKADGSYTEVHLSSGTKILVSKKLKFFEDLLNRRSYIFRPHRSYLINLNHISRYVKGEGIIVMRNNAQLPISRDKKQTFELLVKSHN